MSTRTNKNKTQKGFTLVELAVVLVIIGLLVSSVLVGQDLIKAAQLRATVRQFNDYEVAVSTFIGKYNGIPGDLGNVGNKFGLAGALAYYAGTAGNGDGNGTITSSGSATLITTFTGEMSSFWSHLTTPGKELIPGTYNGDGCTAATVACLAGTDFPAMKFGANGWGVYGVSGVNYFVAGVASPGSATALTVTANSFIPFDAYNIDNKIDDASPTTGNVQGLSAHATVITTTNNNAGVSTTHCGNTSPDPDEYQMTATAAQCVLRFNMTTF